MTTRCQITDPILKHFYSTFLENHPEATGMEIGNMDELTIGKTLKLTGSYFACNSAIKVHVEEQILLTGPVTSENEETPGGCLLVGRSVDLQGPKMAFIGTETDPVVIVGLEGVSIKVTEIVKVQHLTIYLLDTSKFQVDFASFKAFENVKVIRVKKEGNQILSWPEFNWKTHDDFIKTSNKNS